MSRVVTFHQLGGPDVLKIEEGPIPEPGAGEVVLKVAAIGLNRADVAFRAGQYLERASFPARLGFEAAGTIARIGPEVTRFQVGEKVNVLPGFELGRYGTYADHALIPESFVLKQPHGLPDIQAAALWMAYLTAYGGLVEVGRLRAGQWVVISAPSSSVGLAAIQVARQIGALPIATTRSSEKRDALLKAGAEAVIATSEKSLVSELTKLARDGVQLVFDAVGGPAVNDLAEVMTTGAMLILHGALSKDPTPFPLKLAIKKSLSFRGYVYTEITRSAEHLARARAFIEEGSRLGYLRPHVDRTFMLSDVVNAHRYLESNEQFGKVVMTP